MENKNTPTQSRPNNKSRMPENSIFFEKMIPALLVVMGSLMIILILFATGVLVGLIQF